jgi:hypothetical protein
MVWGLETATPALALLVPDTVWEALSTEDQQDLTWYLESLIPVVRAQPEPYLDAFRSAATYARLRATLANLCGECWLIAVGRQAGNATGLLFDKVVVQGNALWENTAPDQRGMKASVFRGVAQETR